MIPDLVLHRRATLPLCFHHKLQIRSYKKVGGRKIIRRCFRNPKLWLPPFVSLLLEALRDELRALFFALWARVFSSGLLVLRNYNFLGRRSNQREQSRRWKFHLHSWVSLRGMLRKVLDRLVVFKSSCNTKGAYYSLTRFSLLAYFFVFRRHPLEQTRMDRWVNWLLPWRPQVNIKWGCDCLRILLFKLIDLSID